MGDPEVILPKIVSRDEWLEARNVLKAEEEDFATMRGFLTTKRRKLPIVEMSEEFVFESPDGKVGLIDLFDGRRQLLERFPIGWNHPIDQKSLQSQKLEHILVARIGSIRAG